MTDDLNLVAKNLNLSFKDKNLLKKAFTHRSFLNEHSQEDLSSNERLEFLGDSIISFWVSKKLYLTYPNLPEGVLTNMRTILVRGESLAQMAENLSLGNYLLLSKGEEKSGGRNNKALLANTFESLTGAIFLDQGLIKTEKFLEFHFLKLIKNLKNNKELKDAKSLLQEKIQEKIKISPDYRVLREEGPDHNKIFSIGVFLQDKLIGQGEGKSKQDAEERAAENALEKYTKLS